MLRILVVDDEITLRLTFGQALRESGYDVSEACNGMEGLNLCHCARPHLVLTDLLMPEKDGLSMIKEVRAIYPTMLIVGMSACPHISELCIASGATRFAAKPLSISRLREIVSEMIPDNV